MGRNKAQAGLAFAALAVGIAGCNTDHTGPSSKLTGKVSYNGQPVKAGSMWLIFDQGKYNCPIRDDGSYSFLDIPNGTAKVVIDTEPFNPDQRPPVYQKAVAAKQNKMYGEYDRAMGKATEEDVRSPGLSKAEKEKLAKVYVKLPKKYTSEKTTDATVNVLQGEQVKDIELTD